MLTKGAADPGSEIHTVFRSRASSSEIGPDPRRVRSRGSRRRAGRARSRAHQALAPGLAPIWLSRQRSSRFPALLTAPNAPRRSHGRVMLLSDRTGLRYIAHSATVKSVEAVAARRGVAPRKIDMRLAKTSCLCPANMKFTRTPAPANRGANPEFQWRPAHTGAAAKETL